jgi:hypothetical protein
MDLRRGRLHLGCHGAGQTYRTSQTWGDGGGGWGRVGGEH